MRLYTFVNFYLSSIQQGIQSAHCVSNLFAECDGSESPEGQALYEWATNHKTLITLNGGNNEGIHNTHLELLKFGAALKLPVTIFYEDEQSLGGIATACAIVVPASVYELKITPNDLMTAALLGNAPTKEEELAVFLRNYSLAR